jgi:hypothetical protein
MSTRPLFLGRARAPGTEAPASAPKDDPRYELAADHLVTHGVCVGMTGSGKTGLCIGLIEEAVRSKVPTLLIDIKGDLANLALTFGALSPDEFKPWVDADAARRAGTTVDATAHTLATQWRDGLARWGLDASEVAALRDGIALRVITPGTSAAEPLHVLSSLETPSTLWSLDDEAARESLSASLSLLLRMIDHEADPAKSREHVLLALLAERRLRAGQSAKLEALVEDLQRPPIARVGALTLDDFLAAHDRASLAQALNTLIASPTFGTWRQGAPLDLAQWFAPRDDARTPAVVLSVAHLDDAERMLVLSLVLEQVLAWVRSLSGTSDLRALVLFDELYGFLPPHPASPPTKRPLMALLKQARAFGVGIVLATQNPMDLDYKALSNAGVWFVGRLQTDADRARVVEGLTGTVGAHEVSAEALGALLKSLPGRTFYVRNVHDRSGPKLLETRWTLSWLRGPMTRQELRRIARPTSAADANAPAPATAIAATTPLSIASTDASTCPAAPDTWKVWHAPAPVDMPPTTWMYQPWVAATIVAHVRDARLGVQANRTVRAMAPLGADGRPDTSRGRLFVPERFTAVAASGVHHAPLPDALFRKAGPSQVEKTLRDEVYRSLQVVVATHKEYALVAAPDEPAADFARRVAAEAQRRATLAQQEVTNRHASKLQRATDAVTAAQAAIRVAEATLPTGGALATAAAFMRGGKRALQRLETQQDRQATRLEKARTDLATAEAVLREATLKRDAELAEVQRTVDAATAEIEQRTLAAKKDDIEVTEIGIAWVPAPRT